MWRRGGISQFGTCRVAAIGGLRLTFHNSTVPEAPHPADRTPATDYRLQIPDLRLGWDLDQDGHRYLTLLSAARHRVGIRRPTTQRNRRHNRTVRAVHSAIMCYRIPNTRSLQVARQCVILSK